MRQANRQHVTKKGLIRRLLDTELATLPDRRGRQGRRIPYPALIFALALGSITALRALRDVESLTARLLLSVRSAFGIRQRISDTKCRDTLINLQHGEVRERLHRQVKAEHRRGNLEATRLGLGVVAIDGKGLGKLDSWDHPDVQKIRPKKGVPYGLARVHRAHLVSSRATVCIDQRPIPGHTNEMGAVCEYIAELIAAYRQSDLFEVITADAGNCSLKSSTLIHDANLGYVLGIKSPAGEIHREALRLLSGRMPQESEKTVTYLEKGARVTYSLWRASLPGGYLGWSHARQLVRLQRVEAREGQEPSVGNRYFVTNLVPGRLDGQGWLTLIRMHWRCENDGHWTADVVWKEDARRTPWTKVPAAVYALSMLRMIGLNILAVLRSLSRRDYDSRPVPWKDVVRAADYALTVPASTTSEHFAEN